MALASISPRSKELNCARVGIRLSGHWHRGPGQTIWANQLRHSICLRGLYCGRDPRGTGDPLLASAAIASGTAANSQLLKALQSVRAAATKRSIDPHGWTGGVLQEKSVRKE